MRRTLRRLDKPSRSLVRSLGGEGKASRVPFMGRRKAWPRPPGLSTLVSGRGGLLSLVSLSSLFSRPSSQVSTLLVDLSSKWEVEGAPFSGLNEQRFPSWQDTFLLPRT